MKADLKKAFSVSNLKLAWHWIKTNPEASYKNYFRHIYKSYSLAEDELLKSLSRKLLYNTFIASDSVKTYTVKKSGILRPITLLAIEDQIVYQALANIIAEKMYTNKSIKRNSYKLNFGHIYKNTSNFTFYKKWQIGYYNFQEKFKEEYINGYDFTASFDLTACYDSISHKVLAHRLNHFKLDKEFISYIENLLSKWSNSSSPNPIYIGHGIPQGPLSSGILAESILSDFDRASKNVKYFRYVDDIRLLSKSENDLRHKLLQLDLKSKSLGLFPQTSKINIHHISNIDNELKNIQFSLSDNIPDKTIEVDPQEIIKKINSLSKRYIIKSEDVTEFKYLLSQAKPKSNLQTRLIKIFEKNLYLYKNIFNCYSKLNSFSEKTSKNLLSF